MQVPWKKDNSSSSKPTDLDTTSLDSKSSADARSRTVNSIFDGFSGSKMSNWWYGLTDKDRMALMGLGCFLFAFGGIFGGVYLNNKSSKQHSLFDKKVNELFWLRSQAANLKPVAVKNSDADSQTSNSQISKVQQSLNQAGIINPTVAQSGSGIQISFQHKSQSVVARVISELQQQGIVFSRLKITQNESASNIKVQATTH